MKKILLLLVSCTLLVAFNSYALKFRCPEVKEMSMTTDGYIIAFVGSISWKSITPVFSTGEEFREAQIERDVPSCNYWLSNGGKAVLNATQHFIELHSDSTFWQGNMCINKSPTSCAMKGRIIIPS